MPFDTQRQNIPYYARVALGLEKGVTAVPLIVGVNRNIGTTFSDVADFGSMTFPTSAESLEIFSNVAGDTLSGDGQRTVLYQGYDENFDLEAPQVIDLTGGVASITGTHIRSRLFLGVTAGSTGQNEGDINLRAVTGGLIREKIRFDSNDGGNGVSFGSFYTVPRNKTALVLQTAVFSPKGEDFTVRSVTRDNRITNSSVNVGGPIPVYQSGIVFPIQTGSLPEKLDFWFQAKSENPGPFTITTVSEIVEFDNTEVGLSALNQRISII